MNKRLQGVYNNFKAVHFKDRFYDTELGFVPPVTLALSLTERCNQRCYYCYLRESNKCGCYLDTSQLLRVLHDAKEIGIKAVDIAGGGEPSFHPDFYKIIQCIRELGLELGLTTNGTNIIASELDFATWIRISIDSFNPITYKTIRNASIIDFSEIDKLCLASNVVMGASCVINPYNYKEIEQFAIEAKRHGFQNVWFKPLEQNYSTDVNQPFLDEISSEIKKALLLVDGSFEVFYRDFTSLNSDHTNDFSRCYCQLLSVFLAADGYFYPCCSIQEFKDTRIASINETDLITMLKRRKTISPMECPITCFQAEKNRFIEYMLDENPLHVNFL